MGGVRGDLQGLERLRRRMNRLAGVDVKVVEIAAPEISADLAAHFGARQSPYGEGWNGDYDLVRSGALKEGATTVKPAGRKAKLELPPYARYQDPRQFMLRSGDPSPAVEQIVERATEQAVKTTMGGG